MSKSRKKTFPAIARLSRAAREIMERAFLQGPGVRSVKSIIEEISEKTREKIDDNAVYRYRDYWLSEERPFIEARRQADAMLGALKENPTADLEELVRQRLTVAQVLTAKQLEGADPVELGYLAQGEKRVELEREKLGVQKERLGVMRERLKQLERALQLKAQELEQAKANAEKVKGALAAGAKPEEVARMVDKILGISA